jgi:uncharacterized protein (DUF1778 family)
MMLNLRVTREEFAMLKSQAKRKGVPLSQFVRGKVLAKEKA